MSNPGTATSGKAHSSPPDRVGLISKMTDAARQRVNCATSANNLTGKSCLITSTHPMNPMQYCHLLPRATKSTVLDSLEESWNIEEDTLHVDTRYNIICLSPSLHRLFDREFWLLVPEPHIVKRYLQSTDNIGKEDYVFPVLEFPGPVFEYTFVPHPFKMEYISIHRQVHPTSADGHHAIAVEDAEPPCEDQFLHFSGLNYHSFPKILSHAKPHFVICNAGEKVLGLTRGWAPDEHSTTRELLDDISLIWQKWTDHKTNAGQGKRPVRKRGRETGGKDDEDDNDATATNRGRAKGAASPEHSSIQARRVEPSPSRKSKKTPNLKQRD